MPVLSKGIKWLLVFSTGCYLAGTAGAPPPRNAERATITIESGHEQIFYPAFGFNEVMHMLAR